MPKLKTVKKNPKKLTHDDEVYVDHNSEFIEFIMHKNNLSQHKAMKLYELGWNSFEGGFSSNKYSNFSDFYSEIFSWKHGNSKDTYHETYKFHAPIDFFRMLSYKAYTSPRDVEVYKKISEFLYEVAERDGNITLVDYGAGLAHITLTLAKILKFRGVELEIVFVDIDRFMFKEFLKFICKKYGYRFKFIDIDSNNPYPKIPKFDFLQIKDVFEHVHYPKKILNNIMKSSKDDSIISATTDDERPEMMHVTTDLKCIRDGLEENNFKSSGKSWFLRGEIYMRSDRWDRYENKYGLNK